MQEGLFGYSLIFELLVLYFLFSLIWDKVEKRWWYAGLLVFGLIVVSNLSAGRWVDLFSGHFEFLWDEVFRNLGFTGH